MALVALLLFCMYLAWLRYYPEPASAHFVVSFQGVTGQVRLYEEARWPRVLARLRQRGAVAVFDTVTNTIHMQNKTWREDLPHEASHLFDRATGVPKRVLNAPVAACLETPGSFMFDGLGAVPMVGLNREYLAYYCARAEVLARYRAMVFRERCGNAGFRSFGIPVGTRCAGMPRYGDLTLDEAVRVAEQTPALHNASW